MKPFNDWNRNELISEITHLQREQLEMIDDISQLNKQVAELTANNKPESEQQSYRDSDDIPTEGAVLRREYIALHEKVIELSEFIKKMFCKTHCEFKKQGCFKECIVFKVLEGNTENKP